MSRNYPQNVEQCVIDLVRSNIISPEASRPFTQNANRTINVPNLDEVEYDPVFSFLIIDKSGSMQKCAPAVIDGQRAILNAWRDSAITRNGAHFITQYLFDEDVRALNEGEQLHPSGRDQVALLTDDLYRPGGRTALYLTLKRALQDLLTLLGASHNQGASPKGTITLISDGMDIMGGADPAEIRNLIQELQRRHLLKSSVVVGLINDSFSQKDLTELRNLLGFEEQLDCNQSSPKDIREKFVMASQSAVARTQR